MTFSIQPGTPHPRIRYRDNWDIMLLPQVIGGAAEERGFIQVWAGMEARSQVASEAWGAGRCFLRCHYSWNRCRLSVISHSSGQ